MCPRDADRELLVPELVVLGEPIERPGRQFGEDGRQGDPERDDEDCVESARVQDASEAGSRGPLVDGSLHIDHCAWWFLPGLSPGQRLSHRRRYRGRAFPTRSTTILLGSVSPRPR